MLNLGYKGFNVFLVVMFFLVSLFLATESAEARRMGFGRSIGKSPPIKRQVAPPAQGTKKAIGNTTGNAANNAVNNRTRGGFMGPLAGLAAGLGLAALASHLGIGGELMGFLLILLAGVAIFFLVRFFLRNMRNNTSLEGVPSNYNKASLENENIVRSQTPHAELNIPDESITEEEKNSFLENSKKQFVDLQKIWDTGNLDNLKSFCTDEFVLVLSKQISEKINEGSKTSVSELNATWEGMNSSVAGDGREVEEIYVLFSGVIRDSEDSPSEDFSEVWTLQRLKSTSDGWLLAGITQTNE